jgi:branched-chain amino acid transport system permease protein
MDCLAQLDPVLLTGQVVAGVATGSVYALVALGLVLIYKTSHVVNFAQGDLLLLGAYAGWALASLGLPFPVVLTVTLILAGASGVLTERLLLRRLVGQPTIAVIIVTLGLSSMLRGLVFLVAGTEVRRFPEDSLPSIPLSMGPLVLPSVYVWSLLVVLAAVICLMLFFRFSRHGIALRATADDQQAAMSMGIRISSAFALSWGLSVAVAATAGILLANLTGVNFTLADLGLLVFPVVILGGLDSIPGAIVGGVLIGLLQNVASGYLDPCAGGGLKTVFPFVVLVAILLAKPHGLFGRVQIERV